MQDASSGTTASCSDASQSVASRNPNLKDKAGREGLLDNQAAKTFRELVSNVLMQSARLYFGSDSDYRRDLLPEIRNGQPPRTCHRGQTQA